MSCGPLRAPAFRLRHAPTPASSLEDYLSRYSASLIAERRFDPGYCNRLTDICSKLQAAILSVVCSPLAGPRDMQASVFNFFATAYHLRS
jgi:hypothetical protein